MRALRLPARAFPLPYCVRSRDPRAPPSFVLAEALPTGGEVAAGPGTFDQPAFRVPACRARGRERDLTGSLAIRPMPLPCSRTPAEPKRPRLWRSRRCCPRVPQTGGLSKKEISRLTQGFSIHCLRFKSDVAATHARLASGWRAAPLPGGRRTLWIASKGFRLHSRPPFQGLARLRGLGHFSPVRIKEINALTKKVFTTGVSGGSAVPTFLWAGWTG